jgi:hypothetical protein
MEAVRRHGLLLLLFFCTLHAQSPESIRPAGSFRLAGVLHDNRALNRPHDVELQGNLAFVPGKGGSLAIIDVADPRQPKLVSSIVDAKLIDDAETVVPLKDTLLLGARDLLAIDIQDPARPAIGTTIARRKQIDRINGAAIRENRLFTANKVGFVTVFDISHPANPRLTGALDANTRFGLQSPHDIAAFGDHIIVVSAARNAKVNAAVIRVADGATHRLLPVSRWTAESTLPAAGESPSAFDLEGANRVVTWGRYAAIGAFVPDRVAIVDLSKPAAARQLANIPVCDIDATGMTIAGQVLFVSGGECVEAIDVSDPANPVSAAQYRGGALFPSRRIRMPNGEVRYDNGHDLVYRDGFLYVTAQNDNRFGILELLDPHLRKLASAGAPNH